jgi:predicted permease
MNALIEVILPVFLVIGAGYTATRTGFFSFDNVNGLMRFSQNFAIPILLFRAISTLDLGASFDPRLLISFYTGAAICFGLGIAGARLLFARPWEDCIVIGFCGLFSNSVLLGLPIMERAYGVDALQGNYAIVALHSPFCYGLGITVMEITRNRGQSGWTMARATLRAMFRNALIAGIALGFFVNISGMTLPVPLTDGMDLMIRAALPAALFALGGVLVQYKPEGDLKAIAMVCGIALIVHPTLVWSFGTALSVPTDAFRSGVVTAAMAPGFNAYIFANMYGHAKRVAASSVLISTGLSIFTVWVWLGLLGGAS